MLDQSDSQPRKGATATGNDGADGADWLVSIAQQVRRSRAAAMVLWPWRYGALALIVAAALVWYVVIPSWLGPVVIADRVIRADFVQTVVASGHVEAPFRVNIGSQVTGIVADIPVVEGQSVKAGDTLIRLDDREARAAVVQAEGLLAQAEARVRQMHELSLPSANENFEQAQATLVNAQQVYDRAAKLAKDGYGTQVKLDDAVRALDVARAQARAAELQVYTSRPGGSDYVMAETQLDQARAGLASAHSKLSYTTITAPRDGILISRDVERGNVVQPSSVLMRLSPSGNAQLVVQIDERNLGLITTGLKALVSADAYPKDTFQAEVAYINPGIDLQRASVEVKLRVPEPPVYLRQDMTVSVDIETARHPDTLIVPVTSVRDAGTNKAWVLKADDGRAVRQKVKTGLIGAGKAEILEGLDEGTLVVPASATAILEGAKVRAQAAPAAVP